MPPAVLHVAWHPLRHQRLQNFLGATRGRVVHRIVVEVVFVLRRKQLCLEQDPQAARVAFLGRPVQRIHLEVPFLLLIFLLRLVLRQERAQDVGLPCAARPHQPVPVLVVAPLEVGPLVLVLDEPLHFLHVAVPTRLQQFVTLPAHVDLLFFNFLFTKIIVHFIYVNYIPRTLR